MVTLCMVLGTILWFVARAQEDSNEIRIATGAKNRQYHICGGVIADTLRTRTGRGVSTLVNRRSELELAIDDTKAVSTGDSHFMPTTIPQGLYHEGPAFPKTQPRLSPQLGSLSPVAKSQTGWQGKSWPRCTKIIHTGNVRILGDNFLDQ